MLGKTLYDGDKEASKKNLISKLIRLPESMVEILNSSEFGKSKMSKYYLTAFDLYKNENPLLSFDYLLEGIETNMLKANDSNSSRLLDVFLKICYSDNSYDSKHLTWDKVFSPNIWNSKSEKRTASFLFLRILKTHNNKIINCNNANARISEFLQENLQDIFHRLHINQKDQTIEKIQKLRSLDNDIFDKWSTLSFQNIFLKNSDDNNLFMQIIGRLKNRYQLFLNFTGITGFQEITKEYQEITSLLNSEAIDEAKNRIKIIEKDFLNLKDSDSSFTRFFIFPIYLTFLNLLKDKLLEYNKPSKLELITDQRLYPFFDSNADITLRLFLKNEGGGFANNITLKIFSDKKIKLDGHKYFSIYWQQLKPGNIPISIPLKVINPFTEHLVLVFTLEWTDWQSEKFQVEDMIQFNCEVNKNIDWDLFSSENRYNLKAITKDEDYSGKEIRIQPIVRDIKTNIQPGWLLGQKRTGKTSTMNGVARALEKSGDFIVSKTNYGRFAHQEPSKMIDQLVVALAKEFIRNENLSIALPNTNGSLAPLVDFLEDVHHVTSKNLFFFIDEFDEIPYAFYIPNKISSPFWQSLRAISQMEFAGFLLVGGENIQHLKTAWGQDININTTHYSDKFKPEEYEYFKYLVTKPTQNELKFQEHAIQEIFGYTGGNPFFAKMFCRVIQKHAVQKHNSYISSLEIEDAILDLVSSEVQMDHFQHYIKDGIRGDDSVVENRKLERAKFLYLISRLLEDNISVMSNELKTISGDILAENNIENLMLEFQERKIISRDDKGVANFNIPIFSSFIRKKGTLELQRFFRDDEELQKRLKYEQSISVKYDELVALARKWKIYQGNTIESKNISSFINQFHGVQLQRKVYEFLNKIRFITNDDLLSTLMLGHKFSIQDTVWQKKKGTSVRHDLFVSYLDGAGKSGAWMARKYLEANQISKDNIIELSQLENIVGKKIKKYEQLKILVLIDDFVGSGNTLANLLNQKQDLLKKVISELNIKVVLLCAYCLDDGREHLLSTIENLNLNIKIFTENSFDDSEKVFSSNSRYFENEDDKLLLKQVFTREGEKLVKNNPLGYSDSQVAIVFPENCPNNSLPILWENKNNWYPLFRRRKN